MSESATSSGSRIKLGAEPKKVGLLLLFLAVAAVLWWRNSSDSPAPSGPPTSASAAVKGESALTNQPAAGAAQTRNPLAARVSRRHVGANERNVFEMRPIDPSRGDVDPTLRLDLLERLKTVKMAGGGRSLFEASATPPPAIASGPGPKIPIGPKKPVAVGPPADMAAEGPAQPPPPAPIPLKFYGFIRPANTRELRRGFFMDGEIVLVAQEGDTLKQRYRVLKFQDNSATMEDTVTKSQQTLQLSPEAKVEN